MIHRSFYKCYCVSYRQLLKIQQFSILCNFRIFKWVNFAYGLLKMNCTIFSPNKGCLITTNLADLVIPNNRVSQSKTWYCACCYCYYLSRAQFFSRAQSASVRFFMFSAAKASERAEASAEGDHRNRKWEAKNFEKVYHLFYCSASILTSCSNYILDVPTITWITPSPHFAAKDVSDVLEVKIENDKTLVRVDWYHNGTLIERTTEGFAFPGKTVIDIGC